MRFDWTITAGTVVSIVSICLTIVVSSFGVYIKLVKHMTKQEEAFKALIAEVLDLRIRADKHDEALIKLNNILSQLLGRFNVLYDFFVKAKT